MRNIISLREALMAGTEQARLKILYLLKLLQEETDEDKGVTMSEILAYLDQHGVPAERKSIYRDIATLQEYGCDIEMRRTRPAEYCLMSRTFDIAELKLLVDAVQSAHFIPEDMTGKLITKLESLTSHAKAVDLRRQVHYSGHVKTENDHVYYTTGTLHDAINHQKRVTFKYIDYTVDKGIQPRRAGASYEISPYALVWNDDKYYVVGYYDRYAKVCNFRVDRMKSVTFSKLSSRPVPEDFSVDDYIKNEFGMFTGETVSLDIRFENSLVNAVMDRFGTHTSIHRDGPDHFIAHVRAIVSPVFYSWLFMFGGRANIVKPARIADEYRKMIGDVMAGTELLK